MEMLARAGAFDVLDPNRARVFEALATDRNNETFFDRVLIRTKPKRGGNTDPPLRRAVDSNSASRIVWQR